MNHLHQKSVIDMVVPNLKNVSRSQLVHALENDSRGGDIFEIIATENGLEKLETCSKGADLSDNSEVKSATAQWQGKRKTNKDGSTVKIEGVYQKDWKINVNTKNKTGWIRTGVFVPEKPDDPTTESHLVWYIFPPESYETNFKIHKSRNVLRPFEVSFHEWLFSISELEKLFKSKDSKMYKGKLSRKTKSVTSKKSSKVSSAKWDKFMSDVISKAGKELEKKFGQGYFKTFEEIEIAMTEYKELESLYVICSK